MDSHPSDPSALDGIAIIGMSGRFPGAQSVEEFWSNLISGKDCISHFTEQELEFTTSTPEAKAQGQTFVGARAILNGVDQFDAAFFNIYPKEAEIMDPQHRLFLECAWESIESAGYNSEAFPGLIGVYAGLSLNTYLLYNLIRDRAFSAKFAGNYQVGAYSTMLGNDKDFLPTRVSYKLNLRGPSMTVQTACSTSLVAISQACTALMNYQCDMALAGGASISFPQKRDYLYTEEGMVSADGTCRTFDANARGTVFGHGVAVVLLKRLADAIQDGDTIHAVIRGSAINNDGSAKIGYAAPSIQAQADVIAMAQAAAGVHPDSISYIEAHGTGTPLGDPIEIAALTQAFQTGGTTRKQYCAIATGKTQIGHLDVAAGATGLIKTVLQLQHEKIPPLLHFRAPNPKIDFANSPFYPVTKPVDWKRGETPRRAGVSAFGVGGTNVHVVLEEAPAIAPGSRSRPQQLILLSAKTESALERMAGRLAEYLDHHSELNLADVAFTLQVGRKSFTHRRAIIVGDRNQAIQFLRQTDPKASHHAVGAAPAKAPRVVFLFPGQGAQYAGMAEELYRLEPVFREEVDRCCEILTPQLGLDLREILFAPPERRAESERQIHETRVTQPAIFVIEYALAKTWMHWGIQPSVLVGHSIGEYVAAVLAETFTLESALQLLAARARLMQTLPAGSMLAVRLGAEEVRGMLPDGISIAAHNSAKLCTVSGPSDRISAFQAALEKQRIASRLLPTSHAFHSAMMDPMLPEFSQLARNTPHQDPAIPWISTRTGTWMTPADLQDGSYWARQVREPVRFVDALSNLVQDENQVFLEVGPGQTLGQLVRQHPSRPASVSVLGSLSAADDSNKDLSQMLASLGRLWIAGVQPNWTSFYQEEKRRRVPLPTYPFERQRFWIEPAESASLQQATATGSNVLELSTASPAVSATPSPAAPSSGNSTSATAEVQPQLQTTGTLGTGPETSTTSAATSAPAPRVQRLAMDLRTLVKELSGMEVSSDHASFMEMGFDSLFLSQASQAIQGKFGVRITFRQLLGDLSTVEALAAHLDKTLPASAFQAPAAAPSVVIPLPGSGSKSPQALSSLPIPSLTLASADPGNSLDQILAQQIQLLQYLQAQHRAQGTLALSAPPKEPSPNAGLSSLPIVRWPGAKPPVNAVATAEQEFKRFGPYKPIEKGKKGGLTPQQQSALESLTAHYLHRTTQSKAYTAENRPHFADPRAVAGFKRNWKEMVYPIVSTRSKGSRIWDLDGNEYVDVTMGFGTYFFGHSPDWLMDALQDQLKTGIEIGPQSALAGKVAKMICEFTGMDRATFCNTGSEAVMAAIRLSRTITGKKRVVYFTGDYHGMFEEVLVRGAWVDGEYRAQPIAPGIPSSLVENMLVLDYGTPESLEIIKAHLHEIAAVLVEPVQSRTPGLRPKEFMHALRALTRESGAALIFDEVVTGFRCHPGGAQAYFGVEADLATYGKVIGGGIPIGVLAGKNQFMDALDGGQWNYGDDSFPEVGVTFFAGTFVRHPLAIAAAYTVLNKLKKEGPELQQRLTERVSKFCEELNAYFGRHQVPIRFPYFSAFTYIEHAHDLEFISLLWYHLRAKGVHIWEGRPCYFTLAHTDADFAFVAQCFKEAVAEMQLGGFLPGTSDEELVEKAKLTLAEWKKQAPPAKISLVPASAPSQPLSVAAGGTEPVEGMSPGTRRFPLTEGQKEMWLSAQIQPEASGAFNASNIVTLKGPLNVECLRHAIRQVVDRHEALRSTLSPDGMWILVSPSLEVDVPVHDFTDLPQVEREARTAQILSLEGQRLFDLAAGPLVTFHILKLSQNEHLLVFSLNMILCDGWGYNVALEEISELYSAFVEGREPALRPIVAMHEYVHWLQQPEQISTAKKAETFWLERFRTPPAPLDLPLSYARPPQRTYEAERQCLRLPAELFSKIKQLAKSQGNTAFAVLFAVYQSWLHRLSGLGDFVVGVPYAGQTAIGRDTLVGQCVHTLPLRASIDATEPFAKLLGRALDLVLDAQENWNTTFGALAQKLDLPRDPSRIPLVSVLFNLDPPMNKVRFSGLTQTVSAGPRYFFQYDLGFNLVDEGDCLMVECDYNRNMFDGDTIRRWVGHYQTMLEAVCENPQLPVGHVPLLSSSERQTMLTEWNRTDTAFDTSATLSQLIEAQAAKQPDRVAVVHDRGVFTYAELMREVNQLAQFLRTQGVQPNTLVGICVDRSLDMIVSVLGVLKAGGAYVPIDPAMPKERIAFLLEDAHAPLVLTQSPLLSSLSAHAGKILCLDQERAAMAKLPAQCAPAATSATDLAYVIYTSGSTGKPKGTEIVHRSVVNFLLSMQQEPGLTSQDVVLALTTLCFDIAGLELFLPLVVGAKVVLASRSVAVDPSLLSDFVRQHQITLMQATPSTWRMLTTSGWTGDPRLKLLCGGEALTPDLAERLLKCCGSLWNVYGPSETTIWSTVHRVQPNTPITLGHPMRNTQVYVVDSQMEITPVGVPGELLIGGVGLARGYRNRPELTAEKFISHPFLSQAGSRVYRTGDLARYHANGEVEFLGRIDFQVKIRGHRIELGEIETVLLHSPDVRDAAVLAREETPGNTILVAYLVPSDSGALSKGSPSQTKWITSLKRTLRSQLPDYMVPSAFVVLERLPQNSNGKVDRKVLPAPEGDRVEMEGDYLPPKTPTEKKLAEIWADLLKLQKVGVRDNFFDLGGQSLRAVSLFARIEKDFGKKLPLATLFKSPTIEQLAKAIDGKDTQEVTEGWSPLVPIQTQGSKPPLFLVHGAGGNVLLYQALARHMAPDYPLYGLQSQGLDAKTPPLNSLEEMAVLYLREVRRVQPKGPYLLGGYCMGGTIAYEMAQRLLQAGESVSMIAMLDTYNFALALKSNTASAFLQRMKFHVANFVKLKPADMMRYIKEKARVARDGEWANLIGAKPNTELPPAGEEPANMREVSVQASNDAACERYLPQPYPGRVLLFKPQVNYDFYPDPNMGWSDLVRGGLEHIELPVNPHAMLVEPFVQTLALELKRSIDRYSGGNAQPANTAMRATSPTTASR